MEQLNWPTLLCNRLETAADGNTITGVHLRCPQTKLTTVRALQSAGYETIAAGDSYNDLDMLQAGKAGFLFRSTPAIRAAHPELPACDTYEELLAGIRRAMELPAPERKGEP